MTIKDMKASEVGATIEYLHSITGIGLPKDPKATVRFLQMKFGGYYKELLTDSFDWFCEGHMDKRPYELSAMFIVEIMQKFLRHGNRNRRYYPAYKLHDEMQKAKSDNESDKTALRVTAERYYTSLYSTPIQYHFVMRDLESLCEYIVRNGWVKPNEIDEETAKGLKDKLKMYNDMKHQHHKQNMRDKFSLAKLGYDKGSKHDYEKALVTAYLIEKRIAEGWTP